MILKRIAQCHAAKSRNGGNSSRKIQISGNLIISYRIPACFHVKSAAELVDLSKTEKFVLLNVIQALIQLNGRLNVRVTTIHFKKL